jgi:hypothetical protein
VLTSDAFVLQCLLLLMPPFACWIWSGVLGHWPIAMGSNPKRLKAEGYQLLP